MTLRFSGHDTFHCKQQWLLKGLRFNEEFNHHAFNNTSEAIKILGVGKNMVSSVKYWLEAFNVTSSHQTTKIGNLLLGRAGFDPYLEDEGTLWLFQFYLCHLEYASIFKIIFSEYFKDKVSYDFTEEKVVNFLNKYMEDNNFKPMSTNTLSTDFKVFIRSYYSSVKENKTLEDDFNSPLLELHLVQSHDKGPYYINKIYRKIPGNIFAFVVLEVSKSEQKQSLSFKVIQETIGNYFCLTNECLEDHIHQLNSISSIFTYHEDGGTANIQIKNFTDEEQINLLIQHYEN